MKSIARYLIPAAMIAALPALRADDPTGGKKDLRVLTGPDGNAPHVRRMFRGSDAQETEVVTFLGVETRAADATLADQLNLVQGTGLIVREVVPDSPAAAVLKHNDVLVKLDDQILIEQRQLAVLVRNHKEGDEITLTFIRGGKENTAKVKLAKHEVPKMAMLDRVPGPGVFAFPFDGAGDFGREDMDRVLALIDQHGPGIPFQGVHVARTEPPQPGLRSTTVSVDNSNMVYSDDQGSLDLTIKDGKKQLVATDPKGTQLFSGPVTTPDERKAMPPEVRARLEKLEGMQEFSFQTDEDFQGGRVQVVKPGKTKIGLPGPATPVPHTSDPF